MKCSLWFLLCGLIMVSLGSTMALGSDTPSPKKQEAAEVKACAEMAFTGFRLIADMREQRFQGKVTELSALCRGGKNAVQFRRTPWIDFTNYWARATCRLCPRVIFRRRRRSFVVSQARCSTWSTSAHRRQRSAQSVGREARDPQPGRYCR